MKTEVLTITSFVPSGHGIADNDWYILGAFPGDVIRARQYKTAEGISYAEIFEIIKPSEHRTFTPTKAPFFDPNAPWQYLSQKQENIEKLTLVRKIFQQQNIEMCHSGPDPESSVHNSRFRLGGRNDNREEAGHQNKEEANHSNNDKLRETGYRNKAAYAFTNDNEQGSLSFALYLRGVSQSGKIAQDENILVHPVINKIGKQFLEFFNQKKVSLEVFKYLTLRYSYYTDTVVAHILVTETNRKKLPWKKSDLETFINQHPKLQGILVSHSKSNIRSANTSKDFYEIGNIEITENILGKKYTYHPTQFFQIYPDAFAKILTDCEKIIYGIPNHAGYELLDFFAGVGVIGLHLAHLVSKVIGVEHSPLAKKYALMNAEQNNIPNFSFYEADVDTALEYIKKEQILIVDPPRSGLTKKSLKKISAVQPEYIIYISCNPETQARDYTELRNFYEISWSRAYNLFPKTPHVEHVLFLTKKADNASFVYFQL